MLWNGDLSHVWLLTHEKPIHLLWCALWRLDSRERFVHETKVFKLKCTNVLQHFVFTLFQLVRLYVLLSLTVIQYSFMLYKSGINRWTLMLGDFHHKIFVVRFSLCLCCCCLSYMGVNVLAASFLIVFKHTLSAKTMTNKKN